MAKKKTTLETLATQMAKGFASLEAKIEDTNARMERGFGAVAEDIAKLATKDQIITLHTQVNAIETELRDTKRHKLVTRVADLEEKVFGEARA
jgi:hypothetical protein